MPDTGSVEMVIGHEDGKVYVRFKRPMEVVLFDPPNCLDVARALADNAFEADTGLKPVGDSLKADLIERHRMTLTARISLMLNGMRENKTVTNGALAQQLVEACLKEVF